MELTIKRTKCTSRYTLSRIYDANNKQLIWLDLVEPPVKGLTLETVHTLPLGPVKLFLKTDALSCSVQPVFAHVAQCPRLFICPMKVETHAAAVPFRSDGDYRIAMWAGRMAGENLRPDLELYDRFITRLLVAKKEKEKLIVNIKQ